jgi:hypothetical protein
MSGGRAPCLAGRVWAGPRPIPETMPMRYRQGKVKREHHCLPEAEPLLQALDRHPAVRTVVPGPIVRKKSAGAPRVAAGPDGEAALAFTVHSPLYVQTVHATVAPGTGQRVLADLRAAGLLAAPTPAPRPRHRAPSRPPAPPRAEAPAAGPRVVEPLPRVAVTAVAGLAPGGTDPDVLARVRAALPALGYARGRYVYLLLAGEIVALADGRVAAAFPYRRPWVAAAAREELAEAGLGEADAEAMVLAAGLWGRTGTFVTQGWELVLDRGDVVGARPVDAPPPLDDPGG